MTIYTDGGCTGNPGPGGWAAVILSDSPPLEISGGEANTTNNRMELTAVIRALGTVGTTNEAIEVLTDSQYVQKGISKWMANWVRKGWKTAAGKPVKNKELWIQLKELNQSLNIKWTWLKGHSGNRWNERCDALVARQREHFRAFPS